MALLDVRDFGAAGDGVTDDTDAIQAAIDATPGEATVVNIPAGDFRIGSGLGLSIGRGDIEIAGAGGAATTLRLLDAARKSGFAIPVPWGVSLTSDNVPADVLIRDLTLDGNHNPHPEGGTGDYFGILLQQAAGITLRRVRLRRWQTDGMTASNGLLAVSGLLVEDCRVDDCGRSGIHIGFAESWTIRRTRVSGTPSQFWCPDATPCSAAHSIDVEVEGAVVDAYVTGGVIEDCLLHRAVCNTSSNGVALQAAYGDLDHVVIRRNVICGHQVAVDNTYNPAKVIHFVDVQDNWISSLPYPDQQTSGFPIHFQGSEDMTATGNVINDVSGGNISNYGAFYLEYAKRVTVTGNVVRMSTFVSPGSVGLAWVRDGCDTVAIEGNSYQTPGDVEVIVEDDPPLNPCLAVTSSGNTALDPAAWDRTQPTCSFALAADSVIDAPTDIVVTASDAGSGIDRVFFFIDGIPSGHSDAAPHTFAFDPADHPAGEHELSAMAVDGQATLGDEVFLTVQVQEAATTTYGLLRESGDGLLREQGDALLREYTAETTTPTARILFINSPAGGILMYSQGGA